MEVRGIRTGASCPVVKRVSTGRSVRYLPRALVFELKSSSRRDHASWSMDYDL
jgi:hypothetical protein